MADLESIDPMAFRAFELAGWEKAANRYHDSFSSVTTQAIRPLLDAVNVRNGVRLLDVATGPGYAAAAAAERGASAAGVDFSAAMVAEARRHFPAVEFREGDAEDLPFPDNTFDAVVMNFGLLHLGRPEQALAEAWRVLRPGGRVGFTVWARQEQAIGFNIVLGAVQTHGNLNVPLPPGPPFFRFSDPDECRRVLLGAGFTNPKFADVPQRWHLPSREALFETMYRSSVRTAGLLGAQTPEALDTIRKAVSDALGPYQRGDTFDLPMPAVLASAVKP